MSYHSRRLEHAAGVIDGTEPQRLHAANPDVAELNRMDAELSLGRGPGGGSGYSHGYFNQAQNVLNAFERYYPGTERPPAYYFITNGYSPFNLYPH